LEQVQFGSSTRNTMLPRRADERSDVDYLAVLKNNDNSSPEALLARLRRFAERWYATSEIYQSRPTVVLSLNHIMFDLVPAYRSWGTLYIPAPSKSYISWTSTDPNASNSSLEDKNKGSSYQIKPLVRLLKYWNGKAGYVYESYELERWVIGQWFWGCTTLKSFLYDSVRSLPETYGFAQWRLDKIRRAKEIVSRAKHLEDKSMPEYAEVEISKLIPPL